MDDLRNYLENSYYTVVISFILVSIAIYVSISKWEKGSVYNFLLALLVSYVLVHFVSMFDIATYHAFDPAMARTFYILEIIHTILELFIFSNIVQKSLQNIKLKKFITIIQITFMVYVIIAIWLKENTWRLENKFLLQLFTTQAIMLIIACIIYYVDLFNTEPVNRLIEQQSFWIITGVTFLMLGSLPFSFFAMTITLGTKLYANLYSIFNVLYCLLFVMIIKSYYAKPT